MAKKMERVRSPLAVEAPEIQDPAGHRASRIGLAKMEALEEDDKQVSPDERKAIRERHDARLHKDREARKKIKSVGKREGRARNKGVENTRKRLARFNFKNAERERAKAARKAKGLPTRNRDRKRSSRPTKTPTWKRRRKLVQMDLFGTTAG
jgi:hypothetical protein